EVDEDDGKVTGTIRADSGIMTVDKENALLKIDLFDVRIEIPSLDAPDDATKTRYVSARKYPIRLDFNELMGSEIVTKKRKNLTLSELIWRIRNPEKAYIGMTAVISQAHNNDLVELNQRICLSIAPFMFVLIAIPLGIKSHRKESSVGMLISLGIVFFHYLFIILSEVFDNNLQVRSWIFPWIPIILSQIGGLILLRRAN
ncbi:MAG TPA: LptF/LptG family permease, partial [Pontiella sp.]|nr:LptF/LptG family permease [Pontiella sp.]